LEQAFIVAGLWSRGGTSPNLKPTDQENDPAGSATSASDEPDDPFMIESTAARTGTHPLTEEPVLPPDYLKLRELR